MTERLHAYERVIEAHRGEAPTAKVEISYYGLIYVAHELVEAKEEIDRLCDLLMDERVRCLWPNCGPASVKTAPDAPSDATTSRRKSRSDR